MKDASSYRRVCFESGLSILVPKAGLRPSPLTNTEVQSGSRPLDGVYTLAKLNIRAAL